jgi:hypothetical protein
LRSAPLTWYRLRWPRTVTAEQVMTVCRTLASTAGWPAVIEAVGNSGRVEHRLAFTESRAVSALEQVRAALPGLALEQLAARPDTNVRRAAELRLTTRLRPLRSDDPAAVNRAVITALALAGKKEAVVVQWVLGRPLAPSAVGNHTTGVTPESWLGALLVAPFRAPSEPDAELRAALRNKRSVPGWQVIGRVGAQAGSPARAQQLLSALTGALRSAEAPGVRLTTRRISPDGLQRATPTWRWPLRLNADELSLAVGWPVGETGELPVAHSLSRPLAPARVIPSRGRVVGRASFPGEQRPLALTPTDSLRHLHVLGPTGVGKSTLLLNLIVQDMAAGRAVVVVEPKGDLIADVLARVPAPRASDVVLLDPTDREFAVGLNPLTPAGRPPELVADQLLGLFHALYADSWGPRTQDILGASLLTLARLPGATLTALPLLLTDAGFRRGVVSRVNDPIGLGSFWSGFEAWSEAERVNAIAPSMNKLRPLLVRPDVRAIVGQRQPRFTLQQVFTERKILLVNLAAGQVGPETAALLGSLVISQLWQAILGRSAVSRERRHPVMVVLDEFQSYLRLPIDLADALAQARGLGAGFTLAHQFLHQLEPAMRSAVLANAQSKLSFRLASEDARLLSSGSVLMPEDFQGLGAFEAYTQLVASSTVQGWCSLGTLPAVEPASDPEAIRASSRQRYGVARTELDAELERLIAGPSKPSVDDLTPRRRGQGGGR